MQTQQTVQNTKTEQEERINTMYYGFTFDDYEILQDTLDVETLFVNKDDIPSDVRTNSIEIDKGGNDDDDDDDDDIEMSQPELKQIQQMQQQQHIGMVDQDLLVPNEKEKIIQQQQQQQQQPIKADTIQIKPDDCDDLKSNICTIPKTSTKPKRYKRFKYQTITEYIAGVVPYLPIDMRPRMNTIMNSTHKNKQQQEQFHCTMAVTEFALGYCDRIFFEADSTTIRDVDDTTESIQFFMKALNATTFGYKDGCTCIVIPSPTVITTTTTSTTNTHQTNSHFQQISPSLDTINITKNICTVTTISRDIPKIGSIAYAHAAVPLCCLVNDDDHDIIGTMSVSDTGDVAMFSCCYDSYSRQLQPSGCAIQCREYDWYCTKCDIRILSLAKNKIGTTESIAIEKMFTLFTQKNTIQLNSLSTDRSMPNGYARAIKTPPQTTQTCTNTTYYNPYTSTIHVFSTRQSLWCTCAFSDFVQLFGTENCTSSHMTQRDAFTVVLSDPALYGIRSLVYEANNRISPYHLDELYDMNFNGNTLHIRTIQCPDCISSDESTSLTTTTEPETITTTTTTAATTTNSSIQILHHHDHDQQDQNTQYETDIDGEDKSKKLVTIFSLHKTLVMKSFTSMYYTMESIDVVDAFAGCISECVEWMNNEYKRKVVQSCTNNHLIQHKNDSSTTTTTTTAITKIPQLIKEKNILIKPKDCTSFRRGIDFVFGYVFMNEFKALTVQTPVYENKAQQLVHEFHQLQQWVITTFSTIDDVDGGTYYPEEHDIHHEHIKRIVHEIKAVQQTLFISSKIYESLYFENK